MVARRVFLLGDARQAGLGLGDRRVGDLAELGEQGLEAMMLEEGAQGRLGNALDFERVERLGQGRIADQPHQLARHARIVGMVDQILAQLGLRDLPGMGEHGLANPDGFVALEHHAAAVLRTVTCRKRAGGQP